ncbi:hypothetical protein GJ633_12015 [Halorubrum sp. CBA1125]|uniref:hypothetical protein n=1 Tax=Halorubrum sp. CBA1125 TaxID=2668072 RepID=UPI0012E8E39D|nr:hypothetical protein [Halorubrum sp. CBA1125]MUW15291.1 hypothetical protein [Halorubrum sp. CBA1125]
MVDQGQNDGGAVTTYDDNSFQFENTGQDNIDSLTIDLSETAFPDMVFDPNGSAGDQGAKGLNIDSQSGDGVGVVSTSEGDVFSEPKNGVDNADGFDVMTIEFTDFEPGETVGFSVDNDPTSIKGATITSQEAGPVSGFELSRATVSVEYASGATQASQLFGDGSSGGAIAALDDSEGDAPTIVGNASAPNVLESTHRTGWETSQATQTFEVQHDSSQVGQQATVIRAEGKLAIDNVPDHDGTPGYNVEEFEANTVEQVEYKTVPLTSGTDTVEFTLSNSTENGGYNYIFATVEDDGGDMGNVSNVEIVKLVEADSGPEPSQNDFDGDGILNANDADDDNDGIDDTSDPFAVDPDNGMSTTTPVDLSFQPGSEPLTIHEVGFTGLMTTGNHDYQDLYDESKVTFDAGSMTVEDVPANDPNNDHPGMYGYQVGFDPAGEKVRINTTVSGLPSDAGDWAQAGVQFGVGDQSNYVKLVAVGNGGDGGIEFGMEESESLDSETVQADVLGPDTETELSIVVDPVNDTITGYYKTEGGSWEQATGASGEAYSLPAGVDRHV